MSHTLLIDQSSPDHNNRLFSMSLSVICHALQVISMRDCASNPFETANFYSAFDAPYDSDNLPLPKRLITEA